MNRVLLCEGETDSVLLSYYLKSKAGWEYVNQSQSPRKLLLKEKNANQGYEWFKKGNDYLLICHVGGKDGFGNFFVSNIMNLIKMENYFDKIAIVLDRDDREIEEIERDLILQTNNFYKKIKNRKWILNEYIDSYQEQKQYEILLLVIPKKNCGALENVLLDSISENSYDKNIVEKSKLFIDEMKEEAKLYLSSDRLALKSHLGVTWAVKFPDRTFKLMDEQINSIDWSKYTIINNCFSELLKL